MSCQCYVQAQAVDDHYAYLAEGKAGLRILDISEPANPVKVDAQDGYIYLASGYGGLYILRYNGQE